MAATRSPACVEIAGDIGLDFVWIDLEARGPSANDAPSVADLQRAAEAADIDLLVRVPPDEPTMLQTVRNTGVNAVIVADIRSAAEVESIVDTCHFAVDGEPGGRWASFSRANRWGDAPPEYPAEADENTVIGVMVEHPDAVADLEAIVSIPELDFVRIGAADLSIQLGHPYDLEHESVRSTIDRIERTCREADMPLSKKVESATAFESAVADGYRVLTIGRDLSIVRSTLRDRMGSIDRRMESG